MYTLPEVVQMIHNSYEDQTGNEAEKRHNKRPRNETEFAEHSMHDLQPDASENDVDVDIACE